MVKNKKNKKNIDLAWGDGRTELFLAPSKKGMEVLSYEYDFDRIHEVCGGRCYYQSRSGCSGAGYIEHYGDLTRVGYYRVDTVHNEFQYPVKLTNEVSIMLPYVSHGTGGGVTLDENPVVIKVGKSTIIYCDFYRNMKEVLTAVLSGQKLKQEPRILKRSFVNTKTSWRKDEEVELKFYNLFGYSFYPWEFATELLEDYTVECPEERVHSLFRISVCKDGTLVRTARIGQRLYATEVLENDPCVGVSQAIPGWEFAGTNMLYKVRENEVYIVGWQLAEAAYKKKMERFVRFIPASEADEFKNFVMGHLPDSKYIEFEKTVPKLLFFLNKEKQFADVRKGIATKVREDVLVAAKQFVAAFNDKQILEAIPDELIVKIEDSYKAGNCEPGTQAFVSQYFPGKTETTAGELKKHAGNWNVMRVLRHIATRDMIAGKVKLELPA